MRGPVLELKHLAMILALARTGRVTDAAEQLGLTPSALSHRIREAERRLGIDLYQRFHKRLHPLPAALHLAQVAERVLGDIARAEADVRRIDLGAKHVVRLAIETYSTYHWLPGFLRRLQADDIAIDLQVVAGARQEPLHHLMNRHVDLVVVAHAPHEVGVTTQALFENELLFIMPPGHRLDGVATIEASDLVGEEFITYTRVPQPDQEYARLFRPANAFPNWTTTIEPPEAIVELVAAGLGTSVLASWAVRGAVQDGRVAAARVGAQGLILTWHMAMRSEDARAGSPVATIAGALAQWCASPGGGFDSLAST